ncbi:hypothetical protein TPDSLph2_CDS0023 [Terrisporobacter phage TPDSL_ph2]
MNYKNIIQLYNSINLYKTLLINSMHVLCLLTINYQI